MKEQELFEKFIDAHAHLDDKRFDEDIEEVIERAKEAGLKAIVTVGCWNKKDGLDKVVEIAEDPFIKLVAGIHPHEAKQVKGDAPYDLLKGLAADNKLVAIGEAGLDFHYDNSPRKVQREVFVRQIALARELGLPLVVHTREAEQETLEILKGEGAGEGGGVIHCFSGTEQLAREALEMGFYLSFTGIITFPKAEELRAVIKSTPVEMMMVETDSPYLAPVPNRGKRCEPMHVVDTARKIAEIKGLSLNDVARITTLNTEMLFRLGENMSEADLHRTIAYPIRNSLYLNITNRCTNQCTFCTKFKNYTVKGHDLKLQREPTVSEVMAAIGDEPQKYDEIVFCGYGESLLRLDIVKEVGMRLKKMGCMIRIDTDGLANLVHGGNVLRQLMFVDCISVSLNAPNSATYEKMTRTPYGDKAFPAILYFLREAKKFIPKVVASVVAVPGLDVEACRKIVEEDIGVAFRVREYNEVG
jgi:TatD DNase family protein